MKWDEIKNNFNQENERFEAINSEVKRLREKLNELTTEH